MSKMPDAPWDKVHLDFYGPLPSGEYLLVVTDRYSRYPEVEIVRSAKASVVIPKLDKVFATHGIPSVVKADNGPPFNSDDFERYLNTLGIEREPSTPEWPQCNAEVERFMQPLGKVIKTAHIEGRAWQQELYRFFLQYRTTPHTTTQVPPSELLFNRVIRGRLPILHKNKFVNRHDEARENEAKKQAYDKQYADKRRNAKWSEIEVADHVLVRQRKKNKLSTCFNKTPYVVTHRHGSQITARNKDDHCIRRNVSHFKKIPNILETETDDDDDHRQPQQQHRQLQQQQQHGQGQRLPLRRST